MLLTVVSQLNSLRPIVPTVALLTVSPTILLAHTSWRVISTVLPKKMYYSVDDAIWGWYQKFVVFMFESCTGVEIVIKGEIPKKKENAVVICNHQTTMDWIVMDFLACRQNMLGHMRFVFKNILKYSPLYGYVWGAHGGIFVKRDGSYNAINMKKTLNTLMDCEANLYFVIYPEGTRFCPGKSSLIEKSRRYAEQSKLEPLSHVLTPRIKAFHCAVSTLGNYMDCVYDATIIYQTKEESLENKVRQKAPSMWDVLSGKCKRIFIQFDRVPGSEIPIVENMEFPTFKWLHMRFKRKDNLLAKYYQSNTGGKNPQKEIFDSGVVSKPIGVWFGSASLVALTAVWLSTPTGRLVYYSVAFGGSLLGMIYAHIFF